jgi:hypothetical protein
MAFRRPGSGVTRMASGIVLLLSLGRRSVATAGV